MTFLLERGVEANAVNEEGWTPLHSVLQYFANFEKHLDVVALLIDKGADVNMPKPVISNNLIDSRGQTPLELAVLWGNEKLVSLLLEKGARVEGRVVNRPLLDYAKHQKNQAIIDALTKALSAQQQPK